MRLAKRNLKTGPYAIPAGACWTLWTYVERLTSRSERHVGRGDFVCRVGLVGDVVFPALLPGRPGDHEHAAFDCGLGGDIRCILYKRTRTGTITKNMFCEHSIDMPAVIAVGNIKIRPLVWVLLPTINSDNIMNTLDTALRAFWLCHLCSFLTFLGDAPAPYDSGRKVSSG